MICLADLSTEVRREFVCAAFWSILGMPLLSWGDYAPKERIRIDEAVRQLAGGQRESSSAKEELEVAPKEIVIPAIVSALRDDPMFVDSGPRQKAYAILVHHQAGEHPLGIQQFIRGLAEPKVRVWCARGLTKVDSDHRAQVIEALTKTLVIPADSVEESSLQEVVRSLGSYGPVAKEALGPIAELFGNPSVATRLRGTAAGAMLQIGGLDWSLDRFQDLEPGAHQGAVTHVGRYLSHADEACYQEPSPEYRPQRDRARQFILKGLESPHRDVRAAALDVIGIAYGIDWIIFHSPDNYEWNPEPRKALEAMLEHESDGELRDKTKKRLDFDIHRAAARLQRDIERAKAKKEGR